MAMSDTTLLQYLLKTTSNQVLQTFNGLSEAHFDTKLVPHAMSPRETLEHLCDCYQNAIATSEGREPAWGAYKLVATTQADAIAEMSTLRNRAISVADEKIAVEYIAVHDAYHVGQLVTLRLSVEPDWNYYSVYDEPA